ncbi:hypothetical protein QYM36_012717 [Artemia franciscana]|uniref:Uncharacterized protein n=1 Tax=Artemia franciscana TaxID=6661 RepID=A0AA88HQY2_ARTSF|nr:hypothetical protein QYM36_012717 [Artemia franciscana]
MDSDSDTDSNYGRNRRDQFSSFKNATIYLIDGSSSMFVEKPLPEESDSAFDVALKSVGDVDLVALAGDTTLGCCERDKTALISKLKNTLSQEILILLYNALF